MFDWYNSTMACSVPFLNYIDCEDVEILWKTVFGGGDPFEQQPEGFDLYDTILVALHDYFQTSGEIQPPRNEVQVWLKLTSILDGGLEKVFYDDERCHDEICPLLGWQGSSDITGIGVRF
jgi:hypothetical protein